MAPTPQVGDPNGEDRSSAADQSDSAGGAVGERTEEVPVARNAAAVDSRETEAVKGTANVAMPPLDSANQQQQLAGEGESEEASKEAGQLTTTGSMDDGAAMKPGKTASDVSEDNSGSIKNVDTVETLNEGEKKSLTEFRERLQNLIGSGKLEPTNEDGRFELWGVPFQPSLEDERTNVLLIKFLRARDFKVDEALKMLTNTLEWRKSYGADNLSEEEFDKTLDNVAFMLGRDKGGRPVCYNVYGEFANKELYERTFGTDEGVDKFIRWRLSVMEQGIRMLDFRPNGNRYILQIQDVKNAPSPFKNKEQRLATKKAVHLLQDHYPELVLRKIFINVPWYFNVVYNMFSPFLTERTKSKLIVASPGKVRETLLKYIPASELPAQYGGEREIGTKKVASMEKQESEAWAAAA